jgi:uncharacterized membrane protein
VTVWAAQSLTGTPPFTHGFGGSANATNGDGSVIACAFTADALLSSPYWWSLVTGFVRLPVLPWTGPPTFSQIGGGINGLSSDGTKGAGATDGGAALNPTFGNPSGNTEAALWSITGAGPTVTVTGLGFLGTGQGSFASDMSGDGVSAVGYSTSVPGYSVPGGFSPAVPIYPFLWTSSAGMNQLALLPGDISGVANAISGNGLVAGGFSQSASGVNTPVIWVSGGPAVAIPFAGGTTFGQVTALSFDGSVATGTMGAARSFLANSGGVALLPLPFAQGVCEVKDMSDDGLTLVGVGSGSFGPGLAWVWTSAGDFVDLPPLIGYTSPAAFGISSDDTTPIGHSFGGPDTVVPTLWAPVLPPPGPTVLNMAHVICTSLVTESPCTAALFSPPPPAGFGPALGLRWSDTRGATWGNPVPQVFGPDPLTQPIWNRTGYARDRVFELFWSFAFNTALNGAFVDTEPFDS